MRLVGKVNQQSIIVLIDTSSTHNFMDINVIRRAKLPIKESNLTVKVANGDTLLC